MARGKKKESLTMEERLEVALVPENEQPYEVQDNWCWTKVGVIATFERGITFPASAKEHELTEKNIPCLRTANIQENIETDDLIYVDKSFMKSNDAKFVRADDIIMSSANSRELVGKVAYVHSVFMPMTFGGFVLGIRAKNIYSKYLFYDLRYEFLCGNFMGESTQTTNIANINTTTLGNYVIPLPPLSEQYRIVERIESLFSKLDEARDKVQEALDGFQLRKSSILQKAFSGELTKSWRNNKGIAYDTWESLTLETVCESIYDGDHMPPPKSEDGIPFLVISNVNDGYLSFENTRFVPEEYYNSLSNTRKPEKGDVLYTLVGSYGIPVVVDSDKPFCFQRHMGLLKPRDVDTYYLWYQMQSDAIYQKVTDIATGTAQLTVPIKGLRKIEIAVPSMDEQQEIVRILNDVLGKEKTIQESIIGIIDQIESIKKSILAKAFRGELGTNDPEDESAIELLKQLIEN